MIRAASPPRSSESGRFPRVRSPDRSRRIHRSPSTTDTIDDTKTTSTTTTTNTKHQHHHPERAPRSFHRDTRFEPKRQEKKEAAELRKGRNRWIEWSRWRKTRDYRQIKRERKRQRHKRQIEKDTGNYRRIKRKRDKKRRVRPNVENRSNDERFDEASSPTARSHKRRGGERRRFVSDEARTLKKSRRPARHAVFPLFLRLLFPSLRYTLLFRPCFSIFLWLTRTDVPRLALPSVYTYRLLSFIRFVQSSPILRIASRPLAVRPRRLLDASVPAQRDGRSFDLARKLECLEILGKWCLPTSMITRWWTTDSTVFCLG